MRPLWIRGVIFMRHGWQKFWKFGANIRFRHRDCCVTTSLTHTSGLG
jgi:hypothetical protein